MKTIELICGGTKTQFTTKSVTYNGVEYFYSRMTDVSHNEIEGFYTFTYNEETIQLPYEEKDSKILATIFNQVNILLAKKASLQKEPAKNNTKEKLEKQIEDKIEKQSVESQEIIEDTSEEKTVDSDNEQQESSANSDKKKPMKKAFIIFGIIIIICAVAAAITFAAFSSSDSASQIVPKATESQQYDDIDEIINDLQ